MKRLISMVVVTLFLGTVFTYAQNATKSAPQEKSKTTTTVKQETKPAATTVKQVTKPATTTTTTTTSSSEKATVVKSTKHAKRSASHMERKGAVKPVEPKK